MPSVGIFEVLVMMRWSKFCDKVRQTRVMISQKRQKAKRAPMIILIAVLGCAVVR